MTIPQFDSNNETDYSETYVGRILQEKGQNSYYELIMINKEGDTCVVEKLPLSTSLLCNFSFFVCGSREIRLFYLYDFEDFFLNICFTSYSNGEKIESQYVEFSKDDFDFVRYKGVSIESGDLVIYPYENQRENKIRINLQNLNSKNLQSEIQKRLK